MRFIANHILDDYESGLSASSEATNFGKELSINPLLFKTWRSTGIISEWLKFDAGAGNTFTLNCCALSNHNFTDDVVLKFQMNDTDVWTSPSLNETLTWREGHIIKYFASTSKRYCRFYIEDPTNTATYLQIGRVTASTYLQVTPSSLADFKIIYHKDDIQNVTPSNNVYGYLLAGYNTYEYDFPRSSSTMLASIKNIYNTNGKVIPFYLMNFDTTWDVIEPSYVIINNDLEQDWNSGKASYHLSLRETGGYN